MKIKNTIQCTAENGEIGNFAYIGNYPNDYKRVTPIFDDLVKLFDYLHNNNIILWESKNKKWSIQIINGHYYVTDGWFCDMPLKHDHNELIVYDFPERIPKYVRTQVYKFM